LSKLTLLGKTMSGTTHQFPKAVAKWRASKKFDRVFALYDAVQERPKIKEYLASDRRQAYGNGIYRHYDELDIEPKE
jgi:glutathione S-transferase